MIRVYTLFIDPYLTNVSTCGNRYRVNCMIYNCIREKVPCMMLDDTKKDVLLWKRANKKHYDSRS